MRKWLILFGAFFLVLPWILAKPVSAQNNMVNGQNVVLGKDETVNKDYFASGNTVTLAGKVNGDAFLVGGQIIIEGLVNGDLLAAGGTVDIRGKVTGNARVVGGQINVSGEVDRNLTIGGGSVNVSDGAKLNGNLVSGAGSLVVYAPVARDITAGAGNATIGSSVGGDVSAGVGQITLTPQATIAGNLTYWSNNQANIESGAKVLGQVTQNYPPKEQQRGINEFGAIVAGARRALDIISLISYLIIGLLFLKFFPTVTEKIVKTISIRPWASLGFGFLTVILVPIIFLLLLVTIIGIPIAFILLAIFLVAFFFTKIFFSLWLGEKVLGWIGRGQKVLSGWALFWGLIIYGILLFVPIVGGITRVVTDLLGLGAIVLAGSSFYRTPNLKKLVKK